MSSHFKPLNILQICPRVPFPTTDGGSIAMFDVYTELTNLGHKVTMLCINTPKHYLSPKETQKIGNIIAVEVNTNLNPLKATLNLFSTKPYIAERFLSKDFDDKIIELLSTQSFDIVQFEGSFVSAYVDKVKAYSKAKCVLRLHNLEYRIWQNLAQSDTNPIKKWYKNLTANRLEQFEKSYFSKFDAVASISPIETEILKSEMLLSNIYTIEAGVEATEVIHNEKQKDTFFIFGSMNWLPNQEGVQWFLDKVWKNLNHTTFKLHIAGFGMPEAMKQLKIPNVAFHGFVSDAKKFRAEHGIMLVPLLSGGGMRIKILEGFAEGKVIISTSKGAEGISVEHLTHIWIADTPQEWINAIHTLSENVELRQKMSENGQILAKSLYSKSAMAQKFDTLYQNLTA